MAYTWKERLDWIHDDKQIKGFFGDYRWLSNFEPCLVEYCGLVFNSSEAAYQAAKCKKVDGMKSFISLSASEAKKQGRIAPLRSDWEIVKLDIMEKILISKFYKNFYLKSLLINTGDKHLEEANWWHDTFWGTCFGIGENNLGKLLMKVRTKL